MLIWPQYADNPSFTQTDDENLFAQRTEETGQTINRDALEYVYEQSGGQPWIVNSLFMRPTMRIFWDEKIYWQEEAAPGGTVTVVGC